jgi:hypothetical protein
VYKAAEDEWEYWNKKTVPERLQYLFSWERGVTVPDKFEADTMRRWKAILDENWKAEKALGSKAGYIKDYLSHVWEDPAGFNDWVDKKYGTAQVGPTWFQKGRTFQYIEDGLAAGFKLKFTNPIDIAVHRLLSGVDMRQRMQLLYELKKMGLSWEGEQGGEHLVKRGWRAINAPDRKQWVIAPDVQRLWENGVEAKGLWQAEHLGGSLFKGWMAIKTAWIPVKLALSAFHPLHVLHINYSNGMARAWNDVVKGKDPIAALKSLGEGFAGPMVAAPGASAGAVVGALAGSLTPVGPYWGGIGGAFAGAAAMKVAKRMGMPDVPHLGKQGRVAWATMPSQQTAEQKAMVNLNVRGGFVPQLSEQMKISAKRGLNEAWQNIKRGEGGVSDWRRFISAILRRPIEVLQKPIFEDWIPNIKQAAYLREAAALTRRDPSLLNDNTRLNLSLRAVSKQIDSRFGEKFYGTMFWNRTLKDSAIASFLSLGWNYGFIDQFGGAAMESVTRPLGILPPFRPNEGRKAIRAATNKFTFALAYLASAALINGLMTYFLSGDMPHGLDYMFARVGGNNPDGTPRRWSNMFYLREIPMLLKHIQERGGNVISGAGEMLWNKLLFEPFHELWSNRDYYGYNIWDENAPQYQQFWQGLKHMLGDQTNPITMSGAKHAAELSGSPFPSISDAIKDPKKLTDALTAKGVPESFLGFNPAPAYVEKTALQNRINYLYREHVAPTSRPEEEGEDTEAKMGVRSKILLARQNKDQSLMQEAFKEGRALGMTQTSLNNTGRTPSDIYLFGRLPPSDQRSILNQASPEEMQRYFPKAHIDIKHEFYSKRFAAGQQSAAASP